jgi:hypothetical protein
MWTSCSLWDLLQMTKSSTQAKAASHVKKAGPGRGGLLDDHVLLQLLKFCLGRLQLLVIKFAKLGSYWQSWGFELMSSWSGVRRSN